MIRLYAALGVLALLVAAFVGVTAYVDHRESAAYTRGYDKSQAEVREAQNAALTQALADKSALEVKLQGVSRDAAVQKENAGVAADRAVVAGDRLRIAEAALRRATQCKASPATGGPSADAASDLLADVQRRLDEATNRVGRFADESRIAGIGCERAYDADAVR